jgi:predicted transcriptional regulator
MSLRRTPPPAPPELTDLESEVMETVWKLGQATVRDVMMAINRRTKRDRAYTTFMTIMARLHEKGVLQRQRDGKTDVYTPVHDRESYSALRVQSDVKEMLDKYGDVALSHFAQQVSELDASRRRQLRRLARKT